MTKTCFKFLAKINKHGNHIEEEVRRPQSSFYMRDIGSNVKIACLLIKYYSSNEYIIIAKNIEYGEKYQSYYFVKAMQTEDSSFDMIKGEQFVKEFVKNIDNIGEFKKSISIRKC